MKRLKATAVLFMLLLPSLALFVPAPATAEAGPMEVLATTDRTVLVELFTGAQCGPCVNVDLGLEAFMENYDHDQVAALVYHRSIPGPDKMETQDTIDRQAFYLPPGQGASTPNYWVDGTVAAVGGFGSPAAGETWFEGQYATQSVNASQLSITVDAQIAPSMWGEVWVNVTALEAPDYANLYMHAVVVKKYYGPWNGGNGVVDHYYTVREMLPDAGGEAFIISSGQTKGFSYEFDLSRDGDLSEYDDMAVIAFVQTHSKNVVKSEVYPRDRYVAPILQSKYADVRTIGNVPPVLSSGHVEAPERLTQDDDLTFKVFYADTDDKPGSGPSEVMVSFKNETNNVAQHLLTPIPSIDPWTEGKWLQWTTKLDPGLYSYMFTGSDGFDEATGDTGWNATTFVVKPRNKVPHLMDPGYVPVRGDTSTIFRFDILYRDEDNEQAVSAKIYINAIPHDMQTTATGPWVDWQLYFYEGTLPVGEYHKFYFVFSDGIDERRFPAATDSPNWISGPEVQPPNNEPSLTTALYTPFDGTRMDEFTFSIIYTDGEDERPTTSFIYIDGTPYVMTSEGTDYSMGVTYRYRTDLELGEHLIHYIFSDGKHEVRYPLVGEFDGPTVTNLAPMAFIKMPANNVRYTPDEYITFSSIGSEDPEDDELDYTWTSSLDGTFSTIAVVDKRLSEGIHDITLTVTDEHGDEDTTNITLTIKSYLPAPYFVDHKRTPDTLTEKDLVKFSVYLNNNGEKTATSLMVSFLVDNTYMGSETVTVAVDSNVEVKFTWVAEEGEHTIAFEIPGDDHTFTEYVDANKVPTISIDVVNPGDGKGRHKIGEEIYFKASVNDANNDELNYLWDFGDGVTSTQTAPSHMFATPGLHTVTLTVTDSRGGQGEETYEIEVKKEETSSNGGMGTGLIAGIVVVVLVIIVVIAVMMMRGRGGEPGKAPPAQEEPRPDVPDYLMPDALPSTPPAAPEEPQYPDYSNGIPEESEHPDYSDGIPEEQPSEEKSEDGYLGY